MDPFLTTLPIINEIKTCRWCLGKIYALPVYCMGLDLTVVATSRRHGLAYMHIQYRPSLLCTPSSAKLANEITIIILDSWEGLPCFLYDKLPAKQPMQTR